MAAAEIGAGCAESAGAEVKGQRDLIALTVLALFYRPGDRAAGADALAHAAADALIGTVSDAPTVILRGFARHGGVHIAAGFTEELRYRFSRKREIHYIFPLFS